MKRRHFSTLAIMTAAQVKAQSFGFEPGRDYIKLDRRATVQAQTNKIEVVDFFWYNCPHCNAFEPALEAWIAKLPSDVQMRRVPVHFKEDFEPQQRLYFTLESMGKVRELHGKVFEEIHQHRRRLNTESDILAWVDSLPQLDTDRFRQHYKSFMVSAKIKQATTLQNEYALSGVPALGIAGQFYIDGALAQNMQRALRVADSLVALVRQQPKSQTSHG